MDLIAKLEALIDPGKTSVIGGDMNICGLAQLWSRDTAKKEENRSPEKKKLKVKLRQVSVRGYY